MIRNVIVRAVPQPEDRLREIREDSLGLNLRDLEIAVETLPQVTRYSATKEINLFALFSDTGRSDGRVVGVLVGGTDTDVGRTLLAVPAAEAIRLLQGG